MIFFQIRRSDIFFSDGPLLQLIHSIAYRNFKNVEDAIVHLVTLPDDDEEEEGGIDIALEPPAEGAESDVDDLPNDATLVDENVNLLGNRLLAMPSHISRAKSHSPTILKEWEREKISPHAIFRYMWNDEIIELIVRETNRNHAAKFGRQLDVTNSEILQVLGILLLSGYLSVSNRRMFWSTSTTTRNEAIANTGMTKNRFGNFIASLHFADNSSMDIRMIVSTKFTLFLIISTLFSLKWRNPFLMSGRLTRPWSHTSADTASNNL